MNIPEFKTADEWWEFGQSHNPHIHLLPRWGWVVLAHVVDYTDRFLSKWDRRV